LVAITLSMAGYAPAALAKPAKGSSATAHDKSVPVRKVSGTSEPVAKMADWRPGPVVRPSASSIVDLPVQASGSRRRGGQRYFELGRPLLSLSAPR
jgi:hypothetical protein